MPKKLTKEEKDESIQAWLEIQRVAYITGVSKYIIYDLCGIPPSYTTNLRVGRIRAPSGWKEKLEKILEDNNEKAYINYIN